MKLANKQRGITSHIELSLFDFIMKALKEVLETQGMAKFIFQHLIQVLSVDNTIEEKKIKNLIIT